MPEDECSRDHQRPSPLTNDELRILAEKACRFMAELPKHIRVEGRPSLCDQDHFPRVDMAIAFWELVHELEEIIKLKYQSIIRVGAQDARPRALALCFTNTFIEMIAGWGWSLHWTTLDDGRPVSREFLSTIDDIDAPRSYRQAAAREAGNPNRDNFGPPSFFCAQKKNWQIFNAAPICSACQFTTLHETLGELTISLDEHCEIGTSKCEMTKQKDPNPNKNSDRMTPAKAALVMASQRLGRKASAEEIAKEAGKKKPNRNHFGDLVNAGYLKQEPAMGYSRTSKPLPSLYGDVTMTSP